MGEISDVVYQALADSIARPRYSSEAWRDVLSTAVASPNNAREWRHHVTWEAVRAVTRWHARLRTVLTAHYWHEIQAIWDAHGGPTWDPWGLAVILATVGKDRIEPEFENFLHHPLRPSAALWVWEVTPRVATWPDLSGVPAVLALDQVLRTLKADVPYPRGPHFWHAWTDWVNEEPPDPDLSVRSRYPGAVFEAWTQALEKADTSEPLAISGYQLTWWDWDEDANS